MPRPAIVAVRDEAVQYRRQCAQGDSYICAGERILEARPGHGCRSLFTLVTISLRTKTLPTHCAAAGLVFIGPPASAICAMGLKAGSKQLMEKVCAGARLSRSRPEP